MAKISGDLKERCLFVLGKLLNNLKVTYSRDNKRAVDWLRSKGIHIKDSCKGYDGVQVVRMPIAEQERIDFELMFIKVDDVEDGLLQYQGGLE